MAVPSDHVYSAAQLPLQPLEHVWVDKPIHGTLLVVCAIIQAPTSASSSGEWIDTKSPPCATQYVRAAAQVEPGAKNNPGYRSGGGDGDGGGGCGDGGGGKAGGEGQVPEPQLEP